MAAAAITVAQILHLDDLVDVQKQATDSNEVWHRRNPLGKVIRRATIAPLEIRQTDRSE